MKRDWDKAVKILKEMGGETPTQLQVEVWPTGMSNPMYSKLKYRAYLSTQPEGTTGLGETAVAAVEDLKRRLEVRK